LRALAGPLYNDVSRTMSNPVDAQEKLRAVGPAVGGSSRFADRDQERALVLAVQRGNSGASQELYEAYREQIYNLALYLTVDASQAQDVLQTVFLKVFRGLARFRFQSSLRTWIYRIAHNECQDFHRRQRVAHVPLEAILGSSAEIDSKPNSDALHGQQEREAIIQQAVMQLPLKMREVVVLKYVEGFSYEEMSKVLGCSAGTVASRLNRALAEMEERLRPFRRLL
jgi:RNA polymerase sigma-70 factor (ECF subfamily)